jgi:hypothetical protein
MPKLKLGAIPDDKPVRLTVTLTAELHALLVEYAEAHARAFDRKVPPEKLVPHMLERFIRTDRAFAKTRRGGERVSSPHVSVGRGQSSG